MKRVQKLSLLQPEITPLSTVCGLNQDSVHRIFDVLENADDGTRITYLRIFIINETLHSVVKRHEEIMPQKGKNQVGAISPCEEEQNITGVY
jgi:hypothetical protein